MHITLKQLKAFRSVASLGQVRLAAHQLNLSQPATSMAIAELENQLDCLLFDRTGNKLVINHQGELLLPMASELLDRTTEIEALFQGLHYPSAGHLKIGASTTIGNYLLPAYISELSQSHPDINIALDIRNTTEIINKVAAFDLDIGCVEGPCYHEDVQVIPWKKDELALVCSPQHPLSNKSSISISELENQSWILREPGSGTRSLFEQHIGHKISSLNIKMELNQAEAIKKLIRSGNAISCLSSLCIQEEIKKGELIQIRIKKISLKRQLSIVLHKKKYQSNLIQLILEKLNWHKQNT